jgi:hypothetical protein
MIFRVSLPGSLSAGSLQNLTLGMTKLRILVLCFPYLMDKDPLTIGSSSSKIFMPMFYTNAYSLHYGQSQ